MQQDQDDERKLSLSKLSYEPIGKQISLSYHAESRRAKSRLDSIFSSVTSEQKQLDSSTYTPPVVKRRAEPYLLSPVMTYSAGEQSLIKRKELELSMSSTISTELNTCAQTFEARYQQLKNDKVLKAKLAQQTINNHQKRASEQRQNLIKTEQLQQTAVLNKIQLQHQRAAEKTHREPLKTTQDELINKNLLEELKAKKVVPVQEFDPEAKKHLWKMRVKQINEEVRAKSTGCSAQGDRTLPIMDTWRLQKKKPEQALVELEKMKNRDLMNQSMCKMEQQILQRLNK
ncbi:Hypothetical_protein [Hexamita inflata]|uniref:Hypothetical_protein n=1 Tax=Hexamita inflata TaxID=28002 RepID=A0AA86QRR9_9EUKA|nr:Hypothetical protein HINF_LOCUS47137 [Hexamita inflata]